MRAVALGAAAWVAVHASVVDGASMQRTPATAWGACGTIQATTSSPYRFVDQCGREVYFRGVNKVNKGPPYYPAYTQWQPGQSLSAADAALFQSLGFNLVRLGVMMTGSMPQPGYVNATYMAAIANITDILATAGVFTLADFHQDTLSPAFCDDGVPVWAALKYSKGAAGFPVPLTSTPFPLVNSSSGYPIPDCSDSTLPWSEYYFAESVCTAFQYMYTQPDAWDDLITHWTAVVQALAPAGGAVAFYELINEPWPGNVWQDPLLMIPGVADLVNLQPFFGNLTAAIRRVEAAMGITPRLIQYDSITWDDIFPVGFNALPGSAQGTAALSFHYYELPNLDVDLQVAARAADCDRLAVPCILTEFDIEIMAPWEPGYSASLLIHTLDVVESYGMGWTGWEYADMYVGQSLAIPTATILSRPFAPLIAGRMVSSSYNTNTSIYALTYLLNPTLTQPTVLFVNIDLHYPTGFTVATTGPVQYTIEHHNTTNTHAGSDGWGTSGNDAAPTPFAFAYVLVIPTAGAGAVNATVTITPP